MRKIIFLTLLILSIIGNKLHREMSYKAFEGIAMSESYVNLNLCLQSLTWLPFASVGIVLLLIPKKTLNWVIEPLSPVYKKDILQSINHYVLRFIGFLLVLTIPINRLSTSCYALVDFFLK